LEGVLLEQGAILDQDDPDSFGLADDDRAVNDGRREGRDDDSLGRDAFEDHPAARQQGNQIVLIRSPAGERVDPCRSVSRRISARRWFHGGPVRGGEGRSRPGLGSGILRRRHRGCRQGIRNDFVRDRKRRIRERLLGGILEGGRLPS
jgi:hypothetical protein